VLVSLNMQSVWASAIGVALGFGVRAGAIVFGWSLPAFRPPEQKNPE
jgi:uncharacterized membrane protein YeiH